jgi:tetratricopeptide (TPR) repeat protein
MIMRSGVFTDRVTGLWAAVLILSLFVLMASCGRREGKNVSREKNHPEISSPTPLLTASLIQVSPGRTDLLEQAKKFYEERNYKKTIEETERVIAANPDYAPAYEFAGDALIEAKRYREAAKYLEKAIKLDPSMSMARIHLGESYFEAGEYYRALEVFKETARIEPDNFDAILDIGETYVELGDLGKAEIYLKRASKMKPGYFSPYNELGNLFLLKNKYNEAEKYYNKSLSLKSDYEDAMMGLSRVYAARKEYGKAENLIKKALKISPYEWGQGLSCLGDIYLMQGKTELAKKAYSDAIKRDVYNSQGYYCIAKLYVKQGKNDEAENMLLQAQKNNGQTAWTGKIYLLLASIWIKRNNIDKGAEYFRKAVNQNKNLTGDIIGDKSLKALRGIPEYDKAVKSK